MVHRPVFAQINDELQILPPLLRTVAVSLEKNHDAHESFGMSSTSNAYEVEGEHGAGRGQSAEARAMTSMTVTNPSFG